MSKKPEEWVKCKTNSLLAQLFFQNEWIARRQESLKTIDQIHREAKQEQQEEQEMIKLMNIHTHPSLAKPGRGDSGDKRRGL